MDDHERKQEVVRKVRRSGMPIRLQVHKHYTPAGLPMFIDEGEFWVGHVRLAEGPEIVRILGSDFGRVLEESLRALRVAYESLLQVQMAELTEDMRL